MFKTAVKFLSISLLVTPVYAGIDYVKCNAMEDAVQRLLRNDPERKLAQYRLMLAAAEEDIDSSSRLRTAGLIGGDTGAIEAEQRATQAGLVRNLEKLPYSASVVKKVIAINNERRRIGCP